MCGRFTLKTSLQLLREFYPFEGVQDLAMRYNIAPTQSVAAVRNRPGDRQNEIVMLRWGLIPFWADDIKIGNRLLNARAETIDEKPSFKHAFQSRRCLILADGFYEWRKIGKAKQPFYLQLKNERPFAFAGLWERSSKTGSVIESCTIITTTPNPLMATIHDRMPVILSPDKASFWLDTKLQDPARLKELLAPYPASDMTATPVSSYVNSPTHESAECIQPVSVEESP